MYLTTNGLVLRITTYNDTDALLTLLTPDNGILTAKARGLRRKNSPLAAACQLLAYNEFVLFENRGFYTINEALCKELFSELRKDIKKLSLATYFAQAAEVIAQEDTYNPELLSLLLNSLYCLSKLDRNETFVKAVFELRLACLAGYAPDLSGCSECNNPIPQRFLISEGRLLCATCSQHAEQGIRMPVTPGVLDAMRYICSCDSKNLFSFQIGEDTRLLLANVTESFLCTQLERGFSTLDFYKSLLI